MRTTAFVLALMVVFLLQMALMLRLAVHPPALPVVDPAPEIPRLTELKVIELERRIAQVDTRLSELQELLKGKPLVRWPGGRDGTAGNASAVPVNYDGWVAILSAPGAAAAVQFTPAPGGETGAGYRYRSVRADQAAEERGEGKVFEKYRKLPGEDPYETTWIDEGSQLTVKAGSVRVDWSKRTRSSGYVCYNPDTMRVYLAAPAEYETLDLRRYMR